MIDKHNSSKDNPKVAEASPFAIEQSPKLSEAEERRLANYHKLLRNFDWNHLRTFYYIAKIKSFTAAAQHLFVSQSALSRIIQHFERTLGERLFIRGSRQLTLTRAGELVLEVATQSFHHIETLIPQIQQDRNLEQGNIRIWAGSGFLRLFLLPYIPDFAKRYPNICLLMTSSKVIPELDLLEADVVIRPPFSEHLDLIQIPLLINHVKLYASQDYLDKFGTPKTPEDLDHHRLIAFGHPPGLAGYDAMNWHLKLGRPLGQERNACIGVDQPEDRLELAAAGLGITTVSQEHPNLEHYNLVEVLPHLTGPTVQCCYIYSANLQASKRIQLLQEYLVDCFTRDYGPPTL